MSKQISAILLAITALLALSIPSFAYKTVQFVSEFGGKGESMGKFSDETRFAFDKYGNIYVLDRKNRRVQKFDPKGSPLMEIAAESASLLARPMDIDVDGNLNIYVVDWKSVHIEGTTAPKLFNYGPCVHKFSNEGKFVATFTLEDLSKKAEEIERAVPAIDTDGNFALMIVPQMSDRMLYISADAQGNVCVLDQRTIYKLSPPGDGLTHFKTPSSGRGQLDKVSDMAVDSKGNIYIADSGNHRVLKFSPDGAFLLSFGKEGDSDGCFTGDLQVTLAQDDTILVADSASYEKILKTSIRHRKLINSNILVTGQDDPLIPRNKEFKTEIRRFQRFDENGKFREKTLYRIDKSDPLLRDLKLKAVDPLGNLYLIDKDRLIVRKYSIVSPVRWSEVDKTFTYRIQHSESRSRLDNFYDLNTYFDFDEREKYTQMTATLRLNYDVTETFNVSFINALMRFDGTTYDKYPGEYGDPGGYIQDDETTDNYVALRSRLDFSLILDHDPFKYRVADLFMYFGGGRYDYDIQATDIQNRRELDQRLWWSVWAAGMRYDMGQSLRFSLTAAHYRPPGYMNYDYIYWDEQGILYATGYGSGASTAVFVSVDGAF